MSSVLPLSLVMRTRLLCGLYSRHAVRPRLRPLAQAYCLTLPLLYWIFFFWRRPIMNNLTLFHWTFTISQYMVAVIASLWTGDEYMYTFFTQNRLTDVTLDSPTIFNRVHRQIKKTCLLYSVLYCSMIGISLRALFPRMGLVLFFIFVLPFTVLDIIITCFSSTKVLVMALFNSRLLVLKRRLERYGFRTVGHAKPQPYCQIYEEIIRGLNATDMPLKVLIFVDLICNCGRVLAPAISILSGFLRQESSDFEFDSELILYGLRVLVYTLDGFSYIVMLESAAVHCEEMAVFTVTQLIKAPTAEERVRMCQFLGLLMTRGVQYRVMRALPIDARLVLQALGFSFSQVIVLYNMMIE